MILILSVLSDNVKAMSHKISSSPGNYYNFLAFLKACFDIFSQKCFLRELKHHQS